MFLATVDQPPENDLVCKVKTPSCRTIPERNLFMIYGGAKTAVAANHPIL